MQELLRNTREVASAPVIFHWVRSSSFPSAIKTLNIKIVLTFPGI